MRNTTITILKAIAIILVVMAHSCCPTYLSRFCYMICVSLFFVASGYCFKTKYVNDEGTFVKRRLAGLYLPYVKWAIFLLVFNHLWFKIGILNEQFGNAEGGVTHPLNWHDGMQALWSIVTNMSGHDQFLGGAFWFFRAMLVSSIVFLIAFKLINKVRALSTETRTAATIAVLALVLALWKTGSGLTWTGLSQGGYRELMGIFFLAAGVLYRQFENYLMTAVRTRPYLDETKVESQGAKRTVRWTNAALRFSNRTLRWLGQVPPASMFLSAVILGLLVAFAHPSMRFYASTLPEVFWLALAGVVGFSFVKNAALLLNAIGRKPEEEQGEAPTNLFRRALLFIGDNTLYIFIWHILAFKLVSILHVKAYGLPWEMIGGHPVVHSDKGSGFWVLYTLVGISLPLLGVLLWRRLAELYPKERFYADLSLAGRYTWAATKAFSRTAAHYAVIGAGVLMTGLAIGAKYAWLGTKVFALFAWRMFRKVCIGTWRNIRGIWQAFVDLIKESVDVKQDE